MVPANCESLHGLRRSIGTRDPRCAVATFLQVFNPSGVVHDNFKLQLGTGSLDNWTSYVEILSIIFEITSKLFINFLRRLF